jgi:hypothetical protein
VDALPIGRLVSSASLGLALDSALTNQIQGAIGGTGWTLINSGGGATVAFDQTAPDGSNTKSLRDDTTTGSAEGAYRASRVAQNVNTIHYFSGWIKLISGDYSGNNTVCAQVFGDGGSTGPCHIVPGATWRRFWGSQLSANLTVQYRPIFVSALGIDVQSTYTGEVAFWGFQASSDSAQKVFAEYYDGALAGGGVGSAHTVLLDNGRLSLEIQWNPRNANTDYGTVYIWRADANNYCTYTGSTGRFNCVINGVSHSPAETLTWLTPPATQQTGGASGRTKAFYQTGVRLVKIWISCGGGVLPTKIQAKVDSAANTTFTDSATAQASISYTGNISVGSNFSDLTAGQMSGHIIKYTTYKTGEKPAWVT